MSLGNHDRGRLTCDVRSIVIFDLEKGFRLFIVMLMTIRVFYWDKVIFILSYPIFEGKLMIFPFNFTTLLIPLWKLLTILDNFLTFPSTFSPSTLISILLTLLSPFII